MKGEKEDWEERVLRICNKAFWPVLVLWLIFAGLKIVDMVVGL